VRNSTGRKAFGCGGRRGCGITTSVNNHQCRRTWLGRRCVCLHRWCYAFAGFAFWRVGKPGLACIIPFLPCTARACSCVWAPLCHRASNLPVWLDLFSLYPRATFLCGHTTSSFAHFAGTLLYRARRDGRRQRAPLMGMLGSPSHAARRAMAAFLPAAPRYMPGTTPYAGHRGIRTRGKNCAFHLHLRARTFGCSDAQTNDPAPANRHYLLQHMKDVVTSARLHQLPRTTKYTRLQRCTPARSLPASIHWRLALVARRDGRTHLTRLFAFANYHHILPVPAWRRNTTKLFWRDVWTTKPSHFAAQDISQIMATYHGTPIARENAGRVRTACQHIRFVRRRAGSALGSARTTACRHAAPGGEGRKTTPTVYRRCALGAVWAAGCRHRRRCWWDVYGRVSSTPQDG